MVRRIDADVLALQEAGPPETLDRLLDALEHRGGYGPPIVGTADARGIRCALLTRVPVLRSEVHVTDALPFPVFHEGDPPPFGARLPLRRGIVHARIDAGAFGPIDLFVAHFKSRRPAPLRDAAGNAARGLGSATPRERAESELRSLIWRSAEALYVRSKVDDVFAADPNAMAAVLGDFNDVAGSVPVNIVAGSGGSERIGELQSCAEVVPEGGRFSIIHRGNGMQIDHILVSAPLRARLKDAWILNDALREHSPVFAGNSGAAGAPCDALPTIDSDHAPFVARFE